MYRLWVVAAFLQAALALGAVAAAAYLAPAGSDPWPALRFFGMFLVMGAGAALSLRQYVKGRNSTRRRPPPDNFPA